MKYNVVNNDKMQCMHIHQPTHTYLLPTLQPPLPPPSCTIGSQNIKSNLHKNKCYEVSKGAVMIKR